MQHTENGDSPNTVIEIYLYTKELPEVSLMDCRAQDPLRKTRVQTSITTI